MVDQKTISLLLISFWLITYYIEYVFFGRKPTNRSFDDLLLTHVMGPKMGNFFGVTVIASCGVTNQLILYN